MRSHKEGACEQALQELLVNVIVVPCSTDLYKANQLIPATLLFFRRRYDTRIVVSSSPSLLGPWSTPSPPLVPQGSEDAWDYVVTNPSPIILQNGTTLMYYRGTPKYWNSSSAADGVGDGQNRRRLPGAGTLL